MLQIPKKITPDNIKDSIVEVQYNSTFPFEITVGKVYSVLTPEYEYINEPVPLNFPNQLKHSGIKFEVVSQNHFVNKDIKIQLSPNSIVFNCLTNYIDWENYFPQIKKILDLIQKEKVVHSYTRVGIRYINQYVNVELNNISQFKFSFGMTDVTSQSYSFSSDFRYKDCLVKINLHSKIPVIVPDNEGPSQTKLEQISQIDVDVIRQNLRIQGDDNESIFKEINEAHSCEKEVFFSLINPDYLEKVKPQY